jgi:hypothetical protein
VSSPPRSGRPAILGWTAHPGFGLLLLFVLAVALIWHGEPQPSSRPSGTSVGVSGTAAAAGPIPGLLVLRDGRLELLRQQRVVRTVALPQDAVPRSMLTSRGLTVVLAVADGRQRAYAITRTLTVRDLGFADAVLPAAPGKAAVVVEAALVDPGRVEPSPTATGPSASASQPSGTTSRPLPGPPPLRDYGIRRYDGAGQPTEPPDRLPRGYRAAVDTSVGMVVWQPVNRVFDSGVVHEALSAAALLVRPDATIRALGPVHPLAADADQLLVWDVVLRRFGVMPLRYVDSTATSTATPTATPSGSATPGAPESSSGPPRPSPTPTLVAGTRWFLPTRGMLLVTGPAAFSADGSAFGVYAQVGSRRRLVVAQLKNLDQVQVLVLNQPPAKSSPLPSGSSLVLPSPNGSGSGAGSSASGSSGSSSAGSSSAAASSTASALEPDGFPIPAPATPLWLAADQVVGVAQDGSVIGYRLGNLQSAQLDLGVADVRALAPAP